MLEIVSAEFTPIVDGHGTATVAVSLGEGSVIVKDVRVIVDNDFSQCRAQPPTAIDFASAWDFAGFQLAVFGALERYAVKHRLFQPPPPPKGGWGRQ